LSFVVHHFCRLLFHYIALIVDVRHAKKAESLV
jgi:hypothetical protein